MMEVTWGLDLYEHVSDSTWDHFPVRHKHDLQHPPSEVINPKLSKHRDSGPQKRVRAGCRYSEGDRFRRATRTWKLFHYSQQLRVSTQGEWAPAVLSEVGSYLLWPRWLRTYPYLLLWISCGHNYLPCSIWPSPRGPLNSTAHLIEQQVPRVSSAWSSADVPHDSHQLWQADTRCYYEKTNQILASLARTYSGVNSSNQPAEGEGVHRCSSGPRRVFLSAHQLCPFCWSKLWPVRLEGFLWPHHCHAQTSQ